jgi:hypothetical protein
VGPRRARGRPVRCAAYLLFLDVDRAAAEQGQRARGRRVRPRSMARHARRWGELRAHLCRRGGSVAGYATTRVLDRRAAAALRRVTFASSESPGSARGARGARRAR